LRAEALQGLPLRLVLTKLDAFERKIEEHDMAPVFNRYVRRATPSCLPSHPPTVA
jgi:hypothetical protein